jgi:hypothetical protein
MCSNPPQAALTRCDTALATTPGKKNKLNNNHRPEHMLCDARAFSLLAKSLVYEK